MRHRILRNVILISTFALTALALIFSEESSDAVLRAMNSCAFTIIPSLFPYMVLSHLIVSTGGAEILTRLFGRFFARVFKVSEYAVTPLILGFLCGFPVGAKNSVELYKSGAVSRSECEHLIAVSNNTGPAFIIEVVGRCYFGSRFTGLIFYLIQLISVVIVGIIYGRIHKNGTTNVMIKPCRARIGFSSQLASAVSSAAHASVTVSGFIVFFSLICSYTTMIGDAIHADNTLKAAVGALLEFSSATKSASLLAGAPAFALAAFAINFSGLSVFAQTAAISDSDGISLLPCFSCKLAEGLVGAATATLLFYIGIFPSQVGSASVIKISDGTLVLFALQIAVLLILTAVLPASKKSRT